MPSLLGWGGLSDPFSEDPQLASLETDTQGLGRPFLEAPRCPFDL